MYLPFYVLLLYLVSSLGASPCLVFSCQLLDVSCNASTLSLFFFIIKLHILTKKKQPDMETNMIGKMTKWPFDNWHFFGKQNPIIFQDWLIFWLAFTHCPKQRQPLIAKLLKFLLNARMYVMRAW